VQPTGKLPAEPPTTYEVMTKVRRRNPRRTAKHKQQANLTQRRYVQLNSNTVQWFTDNLEFDTKAMALKALNPNTGILADYKELQASSHGKQWTDSCSDEIGRLA
jgi:hypothetical protein